MIFWIFNQCRKQRDGLNHIYQWQTGRLIWVTIQKHELNIWSWPNTEAKGVKESCRNKKLYSALQKKSNNDSDIELNSLFCWLAYSVAGRGFFTQQTIILSVSEENSEQKTCVFFHVTTGSSEGLFASS